MYGDCKTCITRRMMMELYGVMRYFDCQGAMIIYNGQMMREYYCYDDEDYYCYADANGYVSRVYN